MVILWTGPLNVLGSVLLPLLSLPPLFLSPCYFRPSYGGSGGRRGLAGGNRDNKGFKTSELPTAKPLSRQREARQPLPRQAFQPHQPWQKAGRTIILTIWPNRWPHSKMGRSLQHRVIIGSSLVLIAAQPGPGLVVKDCAVNKWSLTFNAKMLIHSFVLRLFDQDLSRVLLIYPGNSWMLDEMLK